MKTLPVPEAMLFDLDDTLIDRGASLRRYADALARSFGDRLLGCSIAELEALVLEVDGRHGPGDAAAAEMARLLPWRHAPMTACEVDACWQAHFPESVQATDGMESVLKWLRDQGIRTALVTNGVAAWQGRKIKRLGLDSLMDVVVVSETIGVRKPDPRIFDYALGRLHTASALAWFVGDDPAKDVAAAAATGMVAVWFRRRGVWPPGLSEPGAEIRNLRGLMPLVEAALASPPRCGS